MIYEDVSDYYEKHLKQHGVKMPQKSESQRAKVLVYLAHYLGEWKTKQEIMEGVRYGGNDLQDPRHLWNTDGWYIESNGRRGKELAYRLVSLTEPHPSFSPKRRKNGVKGVEWRELKVLYGNRCACCGAEEGKKHWKPNLSHQTVSLEKGHMDPRLPMEIGNIIPQCSYCNRFYSNRCVFDCNGMVIEVLS